MDPADLIATLRDPSVLGHPPDRDVTIVQTHASIVALVGDDVFKFKKPVDLEFLDYQHTGFVTLNTDDELKRHHQRLRDIIHNTGIRRTWIVVGYSGDADPLLDVLAEREIFEGGLYWVGHDATPSPALERKLLGAGKDAFYLGGQDADRFFTELAQRLRCFPPDLLVRPFSHVETRVTTHIDFSTGGDSGRYHEETLKRLIAKANAAMPEWKRDADVNA